METGEFLAHARLDAQVLETWIAAGWLVPGRRGETQDFSDIDVARVRLILDLRDLGVNDEGIPVVLDLIDQVHGLRRMLRELLAAIQVQSDAARWAADPADGDADDAIRRPPSPGSDRKQVQ